MRIGMMADVYKPHVSGITNYIALNKRYLEEQGHQVFVFTFGDEDYQDDERNVIRSPGLPLLDTGYYISLQYSLEARRLLRTMDLVHVHHPFLTGSLALRYCRPRGIPVIFTNHTRYDLYAQAYLPGVPDVIGVTALQKYLPSFCRGCDLVISPSQGMRKVLVNFGVNVDIDVVPNGVNLTPFQELQPLQREKFGFSKDDVLFAYAGRLGPEKNLTFLLRSFSGILEAYDHVGLIFIGDGPERENLQDMVAHRGLEQRVYFTGMIPYAEMPHYLSMVDAFVTASITEVHPLSVIEAMAAGLPVVGIQSPGVGDTIQDGVTGLLATEADLAAFTAKMIKLAIEHDNRRAMGQAARLAAQDYSIQRTTKMMLERYERVVYQADGRKRKPRARFTRFLDGLWK